MKILILGASGYLGSSILRDLEKQYVVHGTYSLRKRPGLQKLDITNQEEVLRIIKQENPQIIINCAGVSSQFDKDVSLGTSVNIEGTKNVVLGAGEIGASLIHISSIAVFDGKEGSFVEDDTPGSLTKYGNTKIEGEKIVQSSNVEYCIIRPSLILGESPYGMENKDYGKIINAIATNQIIELDNEWIFAPSWNLHISSVIDWWINHQDKANLLHVAASETTTKLQFAQKLCKKLGILPIMFTEKKVGKPSVNNILNSSRLESLGAPTITTEEMITRMASELRTS